VAQDHSDGNDERSDDRAEPLIRLVGSRVAAQRSAVGMTQTELGARMSELRPSWSRSTVVKLERKKRESVSLQDWLALAVALDVPPTWLLFDPHSSTPVPIVEGLEVDGWSAALWMVGKKPITGTASPAWEAAAKSLSEVYEFVALGERLENVISMRRHRMLAALFQSDEGDKADEQLQRVETTEKGLFRELVGRVNRLRQRGSAIPPLPADVIERADELGVDLFGQETNSS
jgi:transcriptional regulator with XRE-family HTH domain